MRLTLTPGQLSRRADFYLQLAQLTGAGLGVQAAFQQIARHPPDRGYRAPLLEALARVDSGTTFTESLKQGDWLPEFDLALLNAAETSGRIQDIEAFEPA